jgi:transcriptional regulator
MYLPPAHAVAEEAEIRRMVADIGSAQFVTAAADGTPSATLLPILWDGDVVIAHMARANPQWRDLAPGCPALLICAGGQAYVSPSWYASKARHGRVVPTWNYQTVHLTGTVRVHDDAEWLRTAVTRLTEAHEEPREQPWRVDDAPAAYLTGQLAGIVGIEVTVTGVEAKAKLSQNRSAADQLGVVTGLRGENTCGAAQIADAMTQYTSRT